MRKLLHLLPTLVALAGCISLLPGCPDSNPVQPDAVCGDGTLDPSEECDDGNQTSGDGCSATCTKEEPTIACGNGRLEAGEECDDMNLVAGDGCSATCTKEAGPKCGDGNQDSGEQCDDGNTTDGDGCSKTCQKEPGAKCGDGALDSGEECDDGNTTPGDGCENNCTKTVAQQICQVLSPLPNDATCEVTAGDAGRLLTGDVLAPGTVFKGGQVVVDGLGKILFVGCDYTTDVKCDAACKAAAGSATAITCPTGVISPALINSHDHITFTQNDPYTDTGERYEHRHDWRIGKNGHTKIPSSGGANANQVAWGELRFLMGGATSTVGSGGTTGLLRNLDKTTQEGLGQTPVDFDTFPLGDTNGTQIASGCGYSGVVTSASIAADDAYLPHVAEGINAFASNEFTCLSSANPGHDVVVDKSAFIHSIGLTPADYALMAQQGTSLIWSPRSNITLYGDTAVVTEAKRLGVLIALGTDWMPSGSMNMLRELQCADSLNKIYYHGAFSDQELWQMATINAAAATATDDVIGALIPGKIADISIFNGANHGVYRAIIDAAAKDVVLVMRGGKVLYGDEKVVSKVPNGACDTLDVCGVSKQVCLQAELGKNLATLQNAVAGIYPAFFCDKPLKEPSCTPTRPKSVMGSTIYTGAPAADDIDGDGIPDAMDNCPDVFNPIRPMDNGAQADADGDGVGDACDVCPLDANTSSCTVFDPNDTDGDGVINAADNCPAVANMNQADADGDGKGDLCDACPNVANPGNASCPVLIHDIKNGTIAANSSVSLVNVLVTARNAKGFYLQEKAGDPGYVGTDYSGVYVFDQSNNVKVGDRVTLSTAKAVHFPANTPTFQIQLTNPVTMVNSSLNEAPPPPVVALPAEVATGGSKADKLEAVLVQVQNVTVTDVTPPAGAGDVVPTNEFVVNGSLRVNDWLYLITPFPGVNDSFGSLTGILEFRNANSKLELRSAADVVGGTPHLGAFGPALSYANVGQMDAPTFPTPLTISLSSAPAADTLVTITSGDPLSLTVTDVTIPAGQLSAPVPVSGLAQAMSVTLTATLGLDVLTANVRVLDPAEQPVIASLTPVMTSVAPGGTATFTVTLDIPAPSDANITLSLGPANAGTIPVSVVVSAGKLSATFDYVDANIVSSATITATLGASMQTATLNIVQLAGGLIINEIDYDQAGTDATEFVEIYNGTGAPVDLSGYQLVLVNGGVNPATVYTTVDLVAAGTLAAGQYLVVGSAAVVVAPGAKTILFAAATNAVQNGGPDGLAIINTVTNTLVDALSYEGSITSVALSIGTVSLVEGNALSAAVADSNTVTGSICRLPNGNDTNDAATDWALSNNPTPGAANVP